MEQDIPVHKLEAILNYNLKEELAIEIANKTGKNLNVVRQLFKYNIMTPDQLAFLLNVTRGVINRAIFRLDNKASKFISHIKITRPFKVSDKIPGPQFVVVEYECIAYIKRHLKID